MRVVRMKGAGRFFVEHDGGAGALLQRECGGNKNLSAEMYLRYGWDFLSTTMRTGSN
jgi:hypothetical protein